jgi:hypothetical protein
MASKILGSLQISALNKIGNIICPANGEFAQFSDLAVVDHVDLLLEEIPPADLADLKMLLTILGLLPSFVLRFILNLLESKQDMNGEIGTLVRTVRFGLRGIIFSLYYSGLKGSGAESLTTPMSVIGYNIQMKC